MSEKNDPSAPSEAWLAMSPIWDKIDTVLAGTAAMRQAAQTYLPQHPREKNESYQERLATSTLRNESKKILETWVGRPFAEKIEIGQDVPDKVTALFSDIDLQGNQLGVFARHWFRDGLSKAFAHVLIDSPRIQTEGRTMADDNVQKIRPYWTLIRPENLIFASVGYLAGREVLTHVRIKEMVQMRLPGEFVETRITQIRVFDRDLSQPGSKVAVSVYRQGQDNKWTVVESGTIDMDEIPIVTFYAHRRGLMLGQPPLEDVVDLNIAHWQSSSDQRNILTVARFPILAVAGGASEDVDSETKAMSPRKILTTPDPSGKWYYVEHAGAAIEAGRQDLKDLEEAMSHYGAEFLTERPGSTTATARALDTAESTSPLQDAVLRFNDAVEQAMVITAKWLNLPPAEAGSVKICTDFTSVGTDQNDYAALQTARDRRDISRVTLLKEYQRRGTLSDDFDEEVDMEQLKDEDATLLGSPTDGAAIDPLAAAKSAPEPAKS